MERRFSAVLIALFLLALCQTIFPQEILRPNGVPAGSSLSSKAWDVLNDAVAHKDIPHRMDALTALGTIGPAPPVVHILESSLQDKDPQVRQTAARALGEMKAQTAIPYLKAALDDTPAVSFSAAKALWELGDKSGRDMFQEVLEGERKNVPGGKLHGAIADGKKKLKPEQLALMGAKDAVGTVFPPAGIGVDAIEEAVKVAKKDTGAPGRIVAAQMLATDPDPYALILLEWATGDDNWVVRVAVAKALGQRGNGGTIDKLASLLADDHHQVRYMAAASMIKLSLKTAPPAASSTLSPAVATKTRPSR